jgi:negative regulator of flagellin synthesis FlgM
LANAEFDATKVARIKEAIEQGNYPLDSKRIAENFMAIESMIGGK